MGLCFPCLRWWGRLCRRRCAAGGWPVLSWCGEVSLGGKHHHLRQHPLSLPTRGFCNNGGLDLSGLGVLALPPPTPLTSRCRWTAAGSHPTPGTMICADFLKTLFQRRVDGLNPASTSLWTVPRAQALFGGELGWPNYGSNRLGRSPSTGPTLFFGATGVSPLWCERASRCLALTRYSQYFIAIKGVAGEIYCAIL